MKNFNADTDLFSLEQIGSRQTGGQVKKTWRVTHKASGGVVMLSQKRLDQFLLREFRGALNESMQKL